MELTDTQWQLFDFVKQMHGSQKRKYSGQPYYTHLMSVADKVSGYEQIGCEIEIALCHDLIEDTECSLATLSSVLIGLGYNVAQDAEILAAVDDLTDKYTTARYPQLNRRQRKQMEAARVISSRPIAQTVKYADMMDNIGSIIADDPSFAKVYLAELDQFIWRIDKGNPALYADCCKLFTAAYETLQKNRPKGKN